MTIRKKWILTLALIAIISIVVNTIVLSILTSQYFNRYLDETYRKTCDEIVGYITKQLTSTQEGEQIPTLSLDSYLGDVIMNIKVYDNNGGLITQATNAYWGTGGNGHGMGMMRGMLNNRDTRYGVTESFPMQGEKGTIGAVTITRYSNSANSYAARMFQSSLFQNSALSIAIVMVMVFFLGFFMSKRISRDLIRTADAAQNIDLGKENQIQYSTTKEIRRIQQSLESLESRLKLKRKARQALVDEMVHQTRTPLTILKMHLEGVEDGIIDLRKEEISVCKNQIDNLSDIIMNISGLIEDGGNTSAPVLEEFVLYPFIKQITNGMRAQFEKKGIDFQLHSKDEITITSDRYRLGQAIYNILTNAYKFTPEKGVVSVHYYQKEKWIVIEIADSGCGISDEDTQKIFQAYYKKNTSTGNGGDGIGLYVAKENIESLHGKIEVNTRLNQGSKFSIFIP
ncbi:MAG: hypothetical protein PWP24_1115 [Clostridiales bacterium]|nr:hypothetical protein [Clostridiales bacterium]